MALDGKHASEDGRDQRTQGLCATVTEVVVLVLRLLADAHGPDEDEGREQIEKTVGEMRKRELTLGREVTREQGGTQQATAEQGDQGESGRSCLGHATR